MGIRAIPDPEAHSLESGFTRVLHPIRTPLCILELDLASFKMMPGATTSDAFAVPHARLARLCGWKRSMECRAWESWNLEWARGCV